MLKLHQMKNNFDEWEIKDAYEKLTVMRMQENFVYCHKKDYFSLAEQQNRRLSLQRDRNDLMSNSWRRKMCLWSYMVVDHFNIDREVVEISFNYLDRYLSMVYDVSGSFTKDEFAIDRKSFQLVSATSLYIAIKLHGAGSNFKSHHNHLVGTFVQLSRGLFTIDDILQMEKELLTALQWKMNPPTSASSIRYVIMCGFIDKEILSSKRLQACANPEKAIYEVGKFFSELSVADFNLTRLNTPSCIALASILNAVIFFLDSDNTSSITADIIKRYTEVFPLTDDEATSLPTVQLQLMALCPFSCSQNSAILNGGFACSQEAVILDPVEDLQPNRSVIESISSPVCSSGLSL